MTSYEVRDLPISPKLKEHGILRIGKDGSTVLINYHDCKENENRCIRFDIDNKSSSKTIRNFDSMVNGAFDPKTKQAIKSTIASEWHVLKNGDNRPNDVNGPDRADRSDRKESVEKKQELQKLSVSKALRAKKGYVKVNGILIGLSTVYNMISAIENTECWNCGLRNEGKIFSKPKYSIDREKRKCINCGEEIGMTPKHISAVDAELQDPDKFNEMERLSVRLLEDNTEDVVVGETVIITGNIYVERKNDNFHNRPVAVLYTESIESNKKEQSELSEKDKEALENWKKSIEESNEGIKQNKKSLIDVLVEMFLPHVIGNEHIKEGILMVFANAGVPNNDKRAPIRFRLHQLIIGDPSLGKSTILRGAVNYLANSRYESCQSSTGLSLTAQVTKEEGGLYTLRTGPIPQAKGSVCGLNEIGQMPMSDHKHFLDFMEEGWSTINKYGFNSKIAGHTSIVATANPIGNSWKNIESIKEEDFPTMKQIVHRCDFISILKEATDEPTLREYLRKRDEIIKNSADGVYDGYEELLRKYFIYARTFNPIISEEARSMLYNYWVGMSKTGVKGLPRKLESLERAIIARAKLKLKNVADVQEAIEVQEFFNIQQLHYQQIVEVSKNPRDVTYSLCLDILREASKWGPIAFEELIKTACKRNGQVNHYVGNDLKIDTNKKLRHIRDMLLNHEFVRQTQGKPTVLQYTETTEDSNLSDLDICAGQIEKENDTKNEHEKGLSDLSDSTDPQKEPIGQNTKNVPPEKVENITTNIDRIISENDGGGLNQGADRSDRSDTNALPFQFEQLEALSPDRIVNHDDLEASLIASGDYNHNTALICIIEMVRDKRLEQVEYLRYRRPSKTQIQKEVI